jgi:site-specific DNA-methyltransferase (adenine-specific)
MIKGVTPYFCDGYFTLYHGDSLELLEKLPENSAHMVFADPPYNLSNGGYTCHGGNWKTVNKGEWDQSKGIQEDFNFHQKWIKHASKTLCDRGSLWVSGTYHSIYACGFAIQLEGMKILNDICWYKSNASPNLSCRYFTASHETLLWVLKNPKAKHTFNYEEMKHGDWHKEDKLKKEGRQMRSVWQLSKAGGKEKREGKHPTQKPLKLLNRAILASTNPGELVVDPFAGSSTTGLAAYTNGRYYIGIEKEEEFLELSVKRYQALKQSNAGTPAVLASL